MCMGTVARTFIQEQDGRIHQQRPRDRNALFLPTRQTYTSLTCVHTRRSQRCNVNRMAGADRNLRYVQDSEHMFSSCPTQRVLRQAVGYAAVGYAAVGYAAVGYAAGVLGESSV